MFIKVKISSLREYLARSPMPYRKRGNEGDEMQSIMYLMKKFGGVSWGKFNAGEAERL